MWNVKNMGDGAVLVNDPQIAADDRFIKPSSKD